MGLGGQVGEFAGGIIGEADAMHNDAMVQYLLDQMKPSLQQGMPATERVNPRAMGRSELSNVTEDPRYKNAENRALDEMMNEALSHGMSDKDKAKLEQSKLAGLDYERGVRGRDQQDLRERGMGTSGAAIASDLSAQQGGIDRAYRGDLQTASDSSDRALAALAQAGGYASNLGTRDLTQKDRAAGANDDISAMNANRTDRADMYNSGRAHSDWMDQQKGMDQEALMEMMMNDQWGQRSRQKWRGYGKEAGGLMDSFDSMGSFGGGGG
jgi:hypothetical protein